VASCSITTSRTVPRTSRETKEAARAALVARLGLGTLLREDLLADHLRSAHAELEEVFVGSTEAYSERPNWQAIAILTTWTARTITPLVTRLAGPDVPVAVPYLAPRVMRACLAAHIHGRRGNDLHKAITSTISPDLTKLKTTLELLSPESQTTWRRRTPDSLAQISTAIASDDVAMASLGTSLQKMVVERDLDALTHATRYHGPEKVLHGALLLSLFRASHPTVTGDLTG
jgi:hypothetical protein